MSAAFLVNQVAWQRHQAALAMIRTTVFINEQHVPLALEWDGLDRDAHHVLASAPNGEPIGCGRMLLTADDPGHIGRMAVLAAWRGQGVGSALLSALLKAAHQAGLHTVHLDAQVSAVGFYVPHGFTAHGPEFMDAGIPHQHMNHHLDATG